MIGAFRSAWMMLTRPRLLWPALGAVILFSSSSIALLFATAASPGGSRLSDPPTTLERLASADAPARLVGQPVMITGLVVLAVAVLHVSSQFSSGFIRVELAYQPRRSRWLLGNWLALGVAAAVTAVIGSGVAILTACICASASGLDVTAWRAGVPGAIGATANLSLGMIAFAIAGSVLAIWLRSAVVALAAGLGYALFENLLNTAAPMGRGLLPASAFTAVATSGGSGGLYGPALLASAILLAVFMAGALGIITSRNVTD